MKQKITLEIENDTGLEFEERAEHRIPKKGEYFIAGQSTGIESAVDDFNRSHYFVLTPKVDHELEEAKRKFPVGSWFKLLNLDIVQQVRSITRSGKDDLLILCTNGQSEHVTNCTPFPIPRWRCCESDPPKETGDYVVRVKGNSLVKTNSTYYADNNVWSIVNGNLHGWSKWDKEWLDEGGE